MVVLMKNEETLLKTFKKKEKVLFDPKLGQLPSIYNLHKEECAGGRGIFGVGLPMFFTYVFYSYRSS